MRQGVGDALKDVAETIEQNRPLADAEKAKLLRVARSILTLPGGDGHAADS